jgi:hypothetical protein
MRRALAVSSGLLLLAALAVHVGVTRPARARSAALADEYRKARDERRESRSRAAGQRQREDRRRRVHGEPPGVQGRPAASRSGVVAVRRFVVGTLEGAGVSTARLSVTPGTAPVGARVTLTTSGSLKEVLRLSTDLARPGGLVLERVEISPAPDGLRLELSGVTLGPGAE